MENMLHIATGDFELVKSVVETFNKVYKTNFTYIDSVVDDGVSFGHVEVGNASQDDIFLLGSFFGSKVRELRDRKEINW